MGTMNIAGRVWKDNDLNGIFSNGDIGQADVKVVLLSSNGQITDYSALTDSDGNFIIENVDDSQEYYGVFSNTPGSYLFENSDSSSVTVTGVTKQTYTLNNNPPIYVPLIYNFYITGIKGSQGPSFPKSGMNSFNKDTQNAGAGGTINPGEIVVHSGLEGAYIISGNTIFLQCNREFMVYFSMNVYPIEEDNSDDLSAGFMLNDKLIDSSISYSKSGSILYGNFIVRTQCSSYLSSNDNNISLINTSDQNIYVNNVNISILEL